MTVKKISNMKEDESQQYIVSWCLQHSLVAVAVPNGMNLSSAVGIMRKYGVGTSELKAQNAKQIALLKKEGLHVGFPDLMIFGEKKGKGTILFMENKVKGNKTSPYQNACGDWLRSLGFEVMTSTSSANAIWQIAEFFNHEDQPENEKYLKERQKISKQLKEKKKCVAN